MVGVCFAQLSVKSKHPLEPFKIKGGLSTYKYSFVNLYGDSIDKKFESKIEYIVKGKWHCKNGKFCILNIKWAKDYIDINKDEIPLSHYYELTRDIGLMLISDIDLFINAIRDVNEYSFGLNDIEAEYALKRGRIYKKKNEELKIYDTYGNELPIHNPENFIEKMIKWKSNSPEQRDKVSISKPMQEIEKEMNQKNSK